MGDRVIYNIKQGENQFVCFYAHWGLSSAFQDLARALDKGRSRWDDPSYLTRIIVSQIVGDQWDETTGFGLWVSAEPCDYEENFLVDLVEKTVTAVDGTKSFEDFANYHTKLNARVWA